MDQERLKKRLLETFKTEAEEHLQIISEGLIAIENRKDSSEIAPILEDIYRSAHSMKGASRAVNLIEIEQLCQELEEAFSMLKNTEFQASSSLFDSYHSTLKTIYSLLKGRSDEKLNSSGDKNDTTPAFPQEGQVDKEKYTRTEGSRQLDAAQDPGAEFLSENVKHQEKTRNNVGSETVKVSTQKIDELYLLAEESLQIKLSHREESRLVKELYQEIMLIKDQWTDFTSEMMSIQKLIKEQNADVLTEKLIRNSFCLEKLEMSLKEITLKSTELNKTSESITSSSELILDNLVDEFKEILMTPFSHLASGLPLLVRDLAHDLGKEAVFSLQGGEIEADRRIIEGLRDPVIHLIRNCIDHGVEKPDIRIAAGKDPAGKVQFTISQIDANKVRIVISDDGAGLDIDKLIEIAIKGNVISTKQAEELAEHERINLVFRSGVTTAPIISDISGRGLGMAIVEENIRKLGASVSIETNKNKGTSFILELPTKVSKSQGLLVEAVGRKYIIPVSEILETLRISNEDIKRVNGNEVIHYNGSTIPLIPLASILEKEVQRSTESMHIFVVVLHSMKQILACTTDEIVNEQEVLFKSLGYPLEKVKNVAGVCLLGNGMLVPILDSKELILSGMKLSDTSTYGKNANTETTNKQISILLAEDSITSRMFLKNILESSGYSVTTAVDGKAALSLLRQSDFDLLVSDIEMPRMDGIELTRMIRNDSKLKELPVVLVTSLKKREDQERGIDAGANAYIIKSSFEESNLLDAIKRLI